MIIILSFPSICFSELKTVQGEYCDVYLGDMKNKKELEEFRETVKTKSIKNGLRKLEDKRLNFGLFNDDKCVHHIISQYLEKVVVLNHTEKDRKICETVKITSDPEVLGKYLSLNSCDDWSDLPVKQWFDDVKYILKKTNGKINIGLIIETKIPDIEVSRREQLENEEEQLFFKMTERNKDKYKLVDRRHLSKVLEEQKLSSSGITDSQTLKLGKLLNLDIIVLRLIYDNSRVTKVLKVDTGEVLLFKTYKTE